MSHEKDLIDKWDKSQFEITCIHTKQRSQVAIMLANYQAWLDDPKNLVEDTVTIDYNYWPTGIKQKLKYLWQVKITRKVSPEWFHNPLSRRVLGLVRRVNPMRADSFNVCPLEVPEKPFYFKDNLYKEEE